MKKMGTIINAGSKNKGGNLEQATKNAKEWLDSIHESGISEVSMSFEGQLEDGDYVFRFKHWVTGKENTLEIHGFTREECSKFIFSPRVYWNGSSTANPEIKDWIADGFKCRIEYYKDTIK
jgi:hypothetical protein